jgi:ankyrin repeat protein
MKRSVKSVTLILILLFVAGCGVAKRVARTPETDALLRAAATGNAETVKALLASPKVDVNGIDDNGNTPLIEAARFGHDQVAAALLAAGADVAVKNNEGQTALTLAAQGGHDQTVRVLMQAGAGK